MVVGFGISKLVAEEADPYHRVIPQGDKLSLIFTSSDWHPTDPGITDELRIKQKQLLGLR